MENSFPHNIKGIIFDLDGTLYRMKWFMKPLLAAILFPRSFLLSRYMAVRKEFAGKEMESGDKLMYSMAEKLSHTCSLDVQCTLSWIHNRFYKAFDSIMPLLRGSRRGIHETLARLKEKGYLLAIVSDFAHINERLTGLDISISLFDSLVSSEAEGLLKPCHKCLVTIAESWKIKPAEVLVVGDRSDTDGVAASNAGMHFIRISEKVSKTKNSYTWPVLKQYFNNLPSIKLQ